MNIAMLSHLAREPRNVVLNAGLSWAYIPTGSEGSPEVEEDVLVSSLKSNFSRNEVGNSKQQFFSCSPLGTVLTEAFQNGIKQLQGRTDHGNIEVNIN